MKLSELLQTDPRIQEYVRDLSQNLGPNECIFAIKIPFGYNFRIIPESRKRWFRLINCPFDPVFITNMELEGTDDVELIGRLFEIEHKLRRLG